MTVHIPDGTPKRAFLNDKEIKYCVYADDARGIVKLHHNPPRLDKYRKRPLTFIRRGVVRVELI